jgi:HAD superfamily hydrolase (TIGR01509 family)
LTALGPVRAVLLDVDGTLIDTNAAHARAWVAALAEAGVRVSLERVRWRIGMGGDKILAQVAGIDADSPLGQQIGERRMEIFLHRHLARCRPLPGARALVQRLKRDGIGCTIASSAQPKELQPLLRRAGVADLIDSAATAGDAEHSKPDPDIVCAALRRAGVAADEALMVGDTPYDIEASGRAGVPIVALRTGGWDDASLAGAAAIYDHPAALLRAYRLRPFAAGAAVAAHAAAS